MTLKRHLWDSEKTYIGPAYWGGYHHEREISGMHSKNPYVPKKDIREGFEERFNIFVKSANTRVECRIGWQTQRRLTLYLSWRMVTSSSIEEATTKGSRRERSLVPSCKITMSRADEATTGRSYCNVLATVLPPNTTPFKCGNCSGQDPLWKSITTPCEARLVIQPPYWGHLLC